MKSAWLLAFAVLVTSAAWAVNPSIYRQGTIIRMHMGDCALQNRGFMKNFGPPQGAMADESCPEYTLVTDKVVFVIVGKPSNQLVPLAEVVDFRFQNNELAMRVDDARKESKFMIKEMVMRSEWEMVQKHVERKLNEPSHESSHESVHE